MKMEGREESSRVLESCLKSIPYPISEAKATSSSLCRLHVDERSWSFQCRKSPGKMWCSPDDKLAESYCSSLAMSQGFSVAIFDPINLFSSLTVWLVLPRLEHRCCASIMFHEDGRPRGIIPCTGKLPEKHLSHSIQDLKQLHPACAGSMQMSVPDHSSVWKALRHCDEVRGVYTLI